MLRHLPNLITVLRMLLVVPMCWMIAAGRYQSALLIAAAAAISDGLDGWLAKRYGWQSWIGGMLDPLADKLLLMAACVWLTVSGDLPPWFVAVVVGRDVVIVAGAIAYHNLVGRFDASPSPLSKLTTVVQLAFVLGELVRLSHWIEVPDALRDGAMWATAALTVASGVHYVAIWGTRARRAWRHHERSAR